MLFLGLLVAYLIGSIPTAYLFGRVLKGIDIRGYGSGNVGATNTFRVIGRVPGLIVLAIDIAKGFLCVGYVASFFMLVSPVARPELYRVLAGLAAIVGHNWTIFLRFKGGKGVATSAGVIIGLIPGIFWLGFAAWAIVFLITGYVSLASIIASITVPVFTLIFNEPAEIIIFLSILCILIVYRHRSNIRRLKQGEEKRINLFKKR
ncbi:MAG: glycerol-3-phosphate 1-O-acyltransferase PlsY [Candidatus Omnitrophica bacterium]|nr:glycerol-3-phosphate 1-O-acyltransferase PlsY [Candidatus Omnitrophota bacterium]MBU4457236.1 glycerol-3-phosphate 1-O-acyltransferase PlsY [Candidatus Omnitrophota bacterium]